MESFVSELAQEVRCSLCKDRFIEPKLLKCFHTYCKACIKRNAELQTDGGGNIFKCPDCLSETSIPELNNVDDLNPSPLHTRISKVLEFVESDKVCSVSKSHSTASWYCFDCTRSLCSDCQSYHSLFTKDNHKTVSLSNLKKEDLKFMLAKEDSCDRHGGCKLDFFCQYCDVLACAECLKSDHDDHSMHNMMLNKEHSSKIRANVDAQLKYLERRQQLLSSRVKILEDIAVQTKDQGERVMKEAREKAKEIIEKVNQNERELIEEIEKHIEKNNRLKREGLSELDQNNSAIKYITKVIERNLPVSKMMGLKESRKTAEYVFIVEYSRLARTIQDDSKMAFKPNKACVSLMQEGFGAFSKQISFTPISLKNE